MQIIKDKITWIDIVRPSREDMDYLKEHFSFHPIIIDELMRPSAREKAEDYGSYLFMVMHFPRYSQEHLTSIPVELDMLVTNSYVITVRYEKLEAFDSMFNKCMTDPHMKDQCFSRTTGHFLYFLIDEVLEHTRRQLAHIGDKLDIIEKNIFSDQTRERIREISLLKRDILDFRRILRPLEHQLKSLEAKGEKFFGERIKVYLSDLVGDFLRVWNGIENYKDTIESLETTHTHILNSRANEIMKIFTILAFTTFPLSLLVGLLSIDLQGNPIFGLKYAFWIIFVLVIVGVITMLSVFKKKRWL